jgi:hypothetical protein
MFGNFKGGNFASGGRANYFIVKVTQSIYNDLKNKGRDAFINTVAESEGNNYFLDARVGDVILFWDENDRAFLGCAEVTGLAQANKERAESQDTQNTRTSWGTTNVNSDRIEGRFKLPIRILRDFELRNRVTWENMRYVPFLEDLDIIRNYSERQEVYKCPELLQMFLIGKGLNIENSRADSRYRYENRGW